MTRNDPLLLQVSEALRNKLSLLNCHLKDEICDVISFENGARTVVWLEDRVIRHDPPENREQLRTYLELEQWREALNAYLDRLCCPVELSATSDKNSSVFLIQFYQILIWLSSHAISLEFEENSESIMAANEAATYIQNPPKASAPPVCAESVRKSVNELYSTLCAGSKQDEVMTVEKLQEIRLKAKELFSQNTSHAKSIMQQNSARSDKSTPFQIASETLRVLYIEDLKKLQQSLNRVIAKAQEYTANPKTDASLGKVGI